MISSVAGFECVRAGHNTLEVVNEQRLGYATREAASFLGPGIGRDARPGHRGPLRIVVPFSGGAVRRISVARAMAQKLRDRFNQPAVVEKPRWRERHTRRRRSGEIASGRHTMLLVHPARLQPDSVQESAIRSGSRPRAGFEPRLRPHDSGRAPVRSGAIVRELVAVARSRPGKLNYVRPARLLSNLCAECSNSMAGVRITHIPYKGTGAALADVLAAGGPGLYMNLLLSFLISRTGRLRALGVDQPPGSPIYPGSCPHRLNGLRGFDMMTWYGLFVQGATPRASFRGCSGSRADPESAGDKERSQRTA